MFEDGSLSDRAGTDYVSVFSDACNAYSNQSEGLHGLSAAHLYIFVIPRNAQLNQGIGGTNLGLFLMKIWTFFDTFWSTIVEIFDCGGTGRGGEGAGGGEGGEARRLLRRVAPLSARLRR